MSGLNLAYDTLVSSVRIFDVTNSNIQNAYLDVGYEILNQNRLRIFIPDSFIETGQKFKIEIISGVQRHVSFDTLEILSPEQFVNVDMNSLESLWTEKIQDQEKYNTNTKLNRVQNTIRTGQNINSGQTVWNNVYHAFGLDLSSIIEQNDNFSILINYGIGAFSHQYSRPQFPVYLKDKSRNTAGTFNSTGLYGIYRGNDHRGTVIQTWGLRFGDITPTNFLVQRTMDFILTRIDENIQYQ